MRRLLILGVGLAPVVAPFAACGGDDATGAAPDSAGDAVDMRRDAAPFDSAPIDAAVDRAPTYNTDGWIGIPFDPDVDCGFYAAPSPEKMPPSIQWEPCDPTMNVSGWACRTMAFTWQPPDQGLHNGVLMAPAFAGWVDEAGRAWFVITRFSGPNAFTLVAEADGPVHTAVVQSGRSCALSNASLGPRRVTFTASRRGSTGGTIYRWGAIGGDVDKVPLVLESWEGGTVVGGYTAGPNAYFTIPQYALRSWASPSAVVAQVPTPSPGYAQYFTFVGDALFFPFGNLSYHRILMYSPDGGTQDFISYGNDVAKGASDFGTDGKDMAWTEAFGRTGATDPWNRIDIVTAPYTTDPSAIQKRRLRSEANSIGSSPFTVGCGYAAHAFSSSTEGTGTRLVRLADGRSWRFTKVPVDGGFAWFFNEPLALNCEELFVGFHRGYQFNVARIRLDSLGPGDPPD